MNIASMSLRILAILGALAAAYMFWDIGNTKDELESQLRSSQNSLSQTQGQLTAVTGEKDELTKNVETLTGNLTESQARANRLDTQLVQVRRELEQAVQAASAREREAETLRADATQIRRQLLEERSRVSQLQETLEAEDVAALQASIRNLERQLLETERDLQTAATDAEGSPSDAPEAPPVPIIRGEVSEVAPESPFVLLNIGSAAGVRSDSSVMIRRGSRYIGRAVVSELNDNSSVAELQPGASKPRAGDFAVTLN